ncbi:AAA family ATPase [Pedobacter alpinus]|uniref:AAA family ATPase n=1 Tax=Pedobacter alpinus TaxID=1590643 RepID=A0ABW5TM55_9SPHI
MSKFNTLYLTKLHLKGYKSILDCEFELKNGLNIIIGKNGAGKSNLFEFIENVVSEYRLEKNFKYSKLDFSSVNKNNFTLEYERIVSDAEQYKEGLASRFELTRFFSINGRKKLKDILGTSSKNKIEFESQKSNLSESLFQFFYKLKYLYPYCTSIKYNLPKNLFYVNKPGSITIDLADNLWDVSNTLSFIHNIFLDMEIDDTLNLNKTNSDNLDFTEIDIDSINYNEFIDNIVIPSEILENLRLFSPIKDLKFSKNITVYVDENNYTIENLKLEFLINDSWLTWSQLSDGSKRLFYLITEITENDGLILIEEPELGIHPHQFELLMDFIKQQSETKQILISTHSPKALDHLNKDELGNILIASYEKGKGTQVRNLTDEQIQNASKYMDEVAFLSDYWLMSDLEE